MKRVLTVLALIAFTGSVFAASGWTKFTNSVNNGINTINQKEQQLNNNIDKAQAERAKQKAEAQKKADAQAAAQKKAYEAQKAKIKAQQDAQKKAYNNTKKNVEEEVSFWKSLAFWRK